MKTRQIDLPAVRPGNFGRRLQSKLVRASLCQAQLSDIDFARLQSAVRSQANLGAGIQLQRARVSLNPKLKFAEIQVIPAPFGLSVEWPREAAELLPPACRIREESGP